MDDATYLKRTAFFRRTAASGFMSLAENRDFDRDLPHQVRQNSDLVCALSDAVDLYRLNAQVIWAHRHEMTSRRATKMSGLLRKLEKQLAWMRERGIKRADDPGSLIVDRETLAMVARLCGDVDALGRRRQQGGRPRDPRRIQLEDSVGAHLTSARIELTTAENGVLAQTLVAVYNAAGLRGSRVAPPLADSLRKICKRLSARFQTAEGLRQRALEMAQASDGADVDLLIAMNMRYLERVKPRKKRRGYTT